MNVFINIHRYNYTFILFVSFLLFPTASVPFWKLKLFLLSMTELITKQLSDSIIHERFWSSHGWRDFKFLLFFLHVAARAITGNLVVASICPGRWGRLTSFHFFASGGLWWSTPCGCGWIWPALQALNSALASARQLLRFWKFFARLKRDRLLFFLA